MFATFTAAIASAMAVDEIRGNIGGPSDLGGNRVATVSGSAGQTYLTGQGIGPVVVDEIEAAYELIDAGDADALVFDAPVLRFHAAREGQGMVTTVGPDFEDVKYGVMTSQDDHELREDINLALLEVVESGAFDQLREKWFGSSE